MHCVQHALSVQLLGLVGASKLPGVVIPLLSQTVLIWQIIVGKLVLGRDLPALQVGFRQFTATCAASPVLAEGKAQILSGGNVSGSFIFPLPLLEGRFASDIQPALHEAEEAAFGGLCLI